jgi:hypothetical protein
MCLYGNFLNRRGCIFVSRAQRKEASREIAFNYDETVSGASVYNTYRDYSPDIGNRRNLHGDAPFRLSGRIALPLWHLDAVSERGSPSH